MRCPIGLVVSDASPESICVDYHHLNPEEERTLTEKGMMSEMVYEMCIYREGESPDNCTVIRSEDGRRFLFPVPDLYRIDTLFTIKVRLTYRDVVYEWSEPSRFLTPGFSESCRWKECPNNVSSWKRYSIKKTNPRVIKHTSNERSTAIGSTPFPPQRVTRLYFKILNSENNGKEHILFGVAPNDIDQDSLYGDWYYGWFLDVWSMDLYSHDRKSCSNEKYMAKEDWPPYTGDSVGIVMDTIKGELSFVVDGVDLGVAYKGIPFDKPLVPCVILRKKREFR